MDRLEFTLIKVLPTLTNNVNQLLTSKNTKKQVELYDDVMTGNITDNRLLRLISLHTDNLGFLIKLIPLPQLIRLYIEKRIFHNYFNSDLVNELVTKNDKDIYYSILNGYDYMSLKCRYSDSTLLTTI